MENLQNTKLSPSNMILNEHIKNQSKNIFKLEKVEPPIKETVINNKSRIKNRLSYSTNMTK